MKVAAALSAGFLVLNGCAKGTGASSSSSATGGGTTVRGLPAGTVALSFQGASAVSTSAGASRLSPADGLMTSETPTADISVVGADGTVLGTLTVTEAKVALKEIKIKLDDDELASRLFSSEVEDDDDDDLSELDIKTEEDDKVKFSGPYVVDLVTSTVSPSLDSVAVIAGAYREIIFKVHKIDGSEQGSQGTGLVAEDDRLYENSIIVSGTYTGLTGAGQVTDMPFAFSHDVTEEVSLEGSQGFVIDADSENSVIVAFRLSKWFDFTGEHNSDRIDFSDVEPVTDSATGELSLILDKDATDDASKLRDVLKHNIKTSADYGEDSDEDGTLSCEEDDDADEEDDADEDAVFVAE